ncbi:hypothetical protein LXL04_036205 [Taraxacum kok-saghyz]
MYVDPSIFDKNLEWLLEVFGSKVSPDDMASAYYQARGDIHKANEILCNMLGSSSSNDTHISTDDLTIMTLMHYLCKVLADKLPEVLDFSKDLSSLEPAAKMQLKYLAEEMQAISKGLEKVVQELSMGENDGPISESFRKALKDFLCSAEGEARSVASLYSNVGKNVDALIIYFGEDPACCPYEQVVSTLVKFVRMFNQLKEENAKLLEAERKKAEKEASSNEKLKQESQFYTTVSLCSSYRDNMQSSAVSIEGQHILTVKEL